jgi:hypothetical protein
MTEPQKGGGIVGGYLRLYELVGNAQLEIATRNQWPQTMQPTDQSVQAACASIWIEANKRRAQQPSASTLPHSETRTVTPAPKPQNGTPTCPKCGGLMFDQKAGKYPWKPGTPIFKCRDKERCDGVIWEPKGSPVAVNAPPSPVEEPDDLF